MDQRASTPRETLARDRAELERRIAVVADVFSGELSVSATHLATGETVELQAGAAYPVSSVMKLGILLTLLRDVEADRVALDTRVDLLDVDRVPGSGILKLLRSGLRPTVEDLATLMVAVSDNTAANLLLDRVGGIGAVNAAMRSLGLTTFHLLNRLDFDVIGVDIALLGHASTHDLDALCRRIALGSAFSPTVSGAAERLLSTQQHLDQALRYLRVAPYAEELHLVQELVTASKTGFSPGVRADAGIVRFGSAGFTYAVATRRSSDRLFAPEDESEVALGLVGRFLTEYWWPAEAGPAPLVDTPYLRQYGFA